MTPENRLAIVQKLSARFAKPMGSIGIDITWENEKSRAGLYTYPGGAAVFLHNAQREIASLDEAQEILQKIFADEIVSVTAYYKEQMVRCVLGPADDPSAGFDTSTKSAWSRGRSEPDIDLVLIENWSQGAVEPSE